MTQIERAARALYQSAPHDFDPNQIGEDETWPDLVDQVRAVLTAIREEPGEAVRQAMRDTVPVDGHEWDIVEREELSNGIVIDPMLDHWRAMIDAALAGKPAP